MPTNNLIIFQHKKGYRYNSDTILLYNFIHSFTCKKEVLEVGYGSGILSLLIKRDFPTCNVTGVDIQEKNYNLALHNAKINHLNVFFTCNDFLSFECTNFDMIVSNPPFYHENSQLSKDEHIAKSRSSLFLPLEIFIQKSSQCIKNAGEFFFCYDAKQSPLIFKLLLRYSLTPEHIQYVHTKTDKEASIVLIRAKKNSKSQTKILSPFILHEENDYTKDGKKAYENANVKSQEWIA